MTRVQTHFIPNTYGFRFPNRFEIKIPVKYPIPLVGMLDLNDIVFGLCGGMCFAALDYYHANEQIPVYQTVKEVDFKLFTYLCERQLDSLKISVVFKVLEWMLLEDREISFRMARSELPKLRKMLDQGEPVVLALIRVHGIGDPSKNHQVLATGYELDPSAKKMTVTLYDPNHPGQEPTLTLDLSKPDGVIKIVQSTQEPLRGFFIIPYKKQTTFPRVAAEEGISFAVIEELPFRLHWPVDSRRVNQYFGENPNSYKPFGLPGHEGLDFFAPTGANIYAAADGEVYEVRQPKEHPYGLQIRILHQAGGKTFRTIYAHLSKAMVQPGQKVRAGDLIGLADNTGNSFGSHLHLTLKIDGVKTPGYPDGIVDPFPYLQEASPPTGGAFPAPSGITVYTTSQVNLRIEPKATAPSLALLPSGEALIALGDAGAVRAKIGVQGEWLPVQTAAGQNGYVEGFLVQDTQQAFPPTDLVVYPFDSVNLRSGPATTFSLLATLNMDQPLTVLGDAESARARLGKQGEWLQVQTEDGKRGFVAAWLVHLTGQTAPPSGFVVYPKELLNVRARPNREANVLTVVAPGDALAVLGDKNLAQAAIGKMDHWLNVRTPTKFVGYVAAWLVQAGPSTPPPPSHPETLIVYPTVDVNMRAQASVNSPRVSGALRNEPLTVVETDLNRVKQKIGKQDAWIYTRNKSGHLGWVAAWYISLTQV